MSAIALNRWNRLRAEAEWVLVTNSELELGMKGKKKKKEKKSLAVSQIGSSIASINMNTTNRALYEIGCR